MTKEQQMLGARLAVIDRRRAEIEFMLSTMPLNTRCCDGGCQREELESELRGLWRFRLALAEQLRPPRQALATSH
jgi:hypothetical protein